MARFTFGEMASDFVAGGSGRPLVGREVKFYDAKTGGNRLSDLLVDGEAATVVTTGAFGRWLCQGPDGVRTMWADEGSDGDRVLVVGTEALQAAGTLDADVESVDARVAVVEAALPDKADAAEVTAALALKANAASLAAKLDTTTAAATYVASDGLGLADPVGTLTLTAAAVAAVPFSIGTDDAVYGALAELSAVMVRSSDGFATVEQGPDFAALGGTGVLVYAGRVAEGYVAILSGGRTTSAHSAGSQFWFSTSFGSGWSQVHTAGRVQGISIGRPVEDPVEGGTVWPVAEYSQTAGQLHKVWLSRDGGQTWAEIHAYAAVNAAQNNHYHGVAFDPVTQRVFVSHGDGDNAWFGYSADYGSTWTPLPGLGVTPATTSYHQSVLMAPLRRGVATTPDHSVGVSGIWMVDRYTGHVIRALEPTPTANPSDQYADAPYAGDGDLTAYAIHPMRGARTSNRVYIAATGDGGASWHKVYDVAQTADEHYDYGIVGPDAAGRLFTYKRATSSALLVGTAPAFVPRETVNLVRAAGGDIRSVLIALGVLDSAGVPTLTLPGGTLTAAYITVNGSAAKLLIGNGSNQAVIDTPTGSNAIYLQVTGTLVASLWNDKLQMAEGKNIQTGTTTGTRIATNATQKLGFYGATPIVRPASTPAAATDLATALTLVNDLRTKLIALGLIA